MKYLLFITFLLVSCKENDVNKDSNDLLVKLKAEELTKNTILDVGRSDFDKAKILRDSCPISISKVELFEEEYSVNKRIRIKFRNSSKKPIDAIKFIVYGENNWGEPEVINSVISSAFAYCETQQKIKADESKSLIWELSSNKVTKVKAEVIKIHFIDGEVWDINNR